MHVAVDPLWAPCDACNCDHGIAPHPKWEIRGILLATNRCPRPDALAQVPWLELFSHYQAGHLLFSGGISDQPAKYVETMHVIAAAVSQARG